ncbi:SsrA-binding protein SmpB [Nitratidesulfovibrio sp. 1201_IL3209]|uniref:SsrA-binding protein SmpB n=1 Tax=Nitratidesulfovibrio sp. 1201_IL3209 TaxID=3084053 RepID=UPI002FD90689
MSKKPSPALIAQNKKARHLYELDDFMEAGLVLTGSEVKSLRAGHVNFRDSYVDFRNGEAFLIGLHIAPYDNAGYAQHDPDRDRKLLLHARQIDTLALRVAQKGLTVVPVNLHFSKGRVKVEIAVGRGKKLHDQREDLKRRAADRDTERELARF